MSLPYFPMFPKDFEAKTSHLTLAEDGAYNRLLRLMWMTSGCTLPADPAWLIRRLRVSSAEFDEVVRPVIDEFFVIKKGRLTQPNLARIYGETSVAHQKRVNAGSMGGKAKALNAKGNSSSNAKAMPKQPEPEPEPYKETKVSSSKEEVADYEEYLKVHPNPVRSKFGETEFFNLIKSGETSKQIISAARAYAEKVAGWSDLGKVQQSDNFICADRGRWRDYVPSATTQKSSRSDLLAFWADAINKKRFVPVSSIKADFARDMVSKGLVTVDQLNEIGISL